MVTEICVESLEEVVIACESGANRVELCSDLSVGGTTPNQELLSMVVEYCHSKTVQVFAMLRCRGGDFVYSDKEKVRMLEDCRSVVDAGVDGIVCGALLQDGSIDAKFMRDVCLMAGKLPLTFHKAFDDSTGDVVTTMKLLAEIGFTRVLSSGRSTTALEGIETLKLMVGCAAPIVIVAGSVRAHNVKDLLNATHALEVHSRSPGICKAI